MNKELREKLINAKSLEEVENFVADYHDFNAQQIWQEIERHQSSVSEKLDLEELDSVSGGARDWRKEGCAATCEPGSWCGSNDFCHIWDVTYDYFWDCCPDGHAHNFVDKICTRCGYRLGGYLPHP
jgi:hypothetical protein